MVQQNEDLLQLLEAIKCFASRFSEFKVSDMKKSISSFASILMQRKDTDDLKAFISQSSSVVTQIFSVLSQRFREVEPDYIQELHYQWKKILGCIEASERAKCCLRNISQMQVLVSHLRNAANRFEQISILAVLCLYTENVSMKQLNLVEDLLLYEIAQLPSPMQPTHQHFFLAYVNIDDTNIFTLKAAEVTPVDFQIDSLEQKHQLWLDFNLKEKSIAFVCFSVKAKKLLCFGIVQRPQVTYYELNNEYQLIIGGYWVLAHGSDFVAMDRQSKIMFTCYVEDKTRIDLLKSHFNLSEYESYDVATAGQDKATEPESTIISFHDCKTESASPDRPDPLLLDSAFSQFSDDDENHNGNVATDWKWILDQDNETEMFHKRKNDQVRETDGQPRKRARLNVERSPPAESLVDEEQEALKLIIQQLICRIKTLEHCVENLTQKVESLLDENTRNQ